MFQPEGSRHRSAACQRGSQLTRFFTQPRFRGLSYRPFGQSKLPLMPRESGLFAGGRSAIRWGHGNRNASRASGRTTA